MVDVGKCNNIEHLKKDKLMDNPLLDLITIRIHGTDKFTY